MTDLFQLLGQQQKTGILRLQDGKKTVQFYFENGKIIGIAFPEETAETSPLGRRLIRGGLISAEAWRKAFGQHREELAGLESVLLKSRAVRNEDLSAVLRLLISETLYGLFKWSGGTFRFEAAEVVSQPHLVEPINTEFLLLDVLRMVDEWPLIADRIPTSDMVIRKVNETGTLEVLAGSAWADKRSFQMEVIYELINGQRTVADIVDQSFVGEFETCKNLITLMDAGVIEPLGVNKIGTERNGNRSRKILRNAGGYLLLGGVFLILVFQLIGVRAETFPFSPQEYEGWKTLRRPAERMAEKKNGNAAEVFLIEKNRYPLDKSELVKNGLIPRAHLSPDQMKP